MGDGWITSTAFLCPKKALGNIFKLLSESPASWSLCVTLKWCSRFLLTKALLSAGVGKEGTERIAGYKLQDSSRYLNCCCDKTWVKQRPWLYFPGLTLSCSGSRWQRNMVQSSLASTVSGQGAGWLIPKAWELIWTCSGGWAHWIETQMILERARGHKAVPDMFFTATKN